MDNDKEPNVTLDSAPEFDIYATQPVIAAGTPIKLNLGSGPFKPAPADHPMAFLNSFTHHIDAMWFPGVTTVMDLGRERWPFEDSSVDEAHASHFYEHLRGYRYSDDEPWTSVPRVFFLNELYRVLKPGASCKIITPHWCSQRAYGDLTHQWPPVSEFHWFYVSKQWRDQNAPHNNFYTCNFNAVWGHGMSPEIMVRNQDYQQWALGNLKEAAADLHVTVTAVK